jgi:hypothetical protein
MGMPSPRAFFAFALTAYMFDLMTRAWVAVDAEGWKKAASYNETGDVIACIAATVAVALMFLAAWRFKACPGGEASTLFAAGVAFYLLVNASNKWTKYDIGTPPTKTRSELTFILPCIFATIAFLATAFSAVKLNGSGDMPAAAFVGGFALWFFANAVEQSKAYDNNKNPTDILNDGNKAAVMMMGLSYLGAFGALCFAASKYQEDMARAAWTAGWGFWLMSSAVYYFGVYDQTYEKQTDKDTFKARDAIGALFVTVAVALYGFAAFKANQGGNSEGAMPAVLFIAANMFWVFDTFVTKWNAYDKAYESQTDKDTNAAAAWFQALFLTAAVIAYGVCGKMAIACPDGINWSSGGDKVVPISA